LPASPGELLFQSVAVVLVDPLQNAIEVCGNDRAVPVTKQLGTAVNLGYVWGMVWGVSSNDKEKGLGFIIQALDFLLEGDAGIEPATFGSGDQRSIH
jgi:hypothetical protein